MEEGRVAIARARHAAVYPARFMFLAATNPCPCGYAGEGERCRCSEADLARHRRRLSGPLLDRIDLLANLQATHGDDLATEPVTSSKATRELVSDARDRQRARLAGERVCLNAHMDVPALTRHVRLDATGEGLVRDAARRGLLSARGVHRVLRVARTIADVEGSGRVRARDVAGALALRCEAALAAGAER